MRFNHCGTQELEILGVRATPWVGGNGVGVKGTGWPMTTRAQPVPVARIYRRRDIHNLFAPSSASYRDVSLIPETDKPHFH